MIKRIIVSKSLISSIQNYLSNNNLGNRGFEDGSIRKQEVGLLGELEVHRYLHGFYPDLNNRTKGFDGGFDITYNHKKIDVKTMERQSYVRPSFVNNFYLMQEYYVADTIIFCSYHKKDNVLEICGWIPKTELPSRGIFYKAGTKRIRTNGTSFTFRQDNYEVEVKDLYDIEKLK